MRKFAVIFFCALAAAVSAGDVATFVGLGFSPDGSRYSFGQYGVSDGDFRAYADVSCVDVAKNAFLNDGSFTAAPSAKTAGKDGKGVFAALQNSAAPYLKKVGIDSADQGRALYVRSDDSSDAPAAPIEFRDFETGARYSVALNAYVEGAGPDVTSSFYIIAEVTDAAGKTVRKTVGHPGFKRAGVSSYAIRRIIADEKGKSLVFIVEKTMPSARGSSVRFMVETLRLP